MKLKEAVRLYFVRKENRIRNLENQVSNLQNSVDWLLSTQRDNNDNFKLLNEKIAILARKVTNDHH